MADIEFQDEQMYAERPVAREKGLTALVQKWGLAKDAKQAQYVLLGVAAIAIILAVIIPFVFGSPLAAPLPSGTVIVNTPGTPPHLLNPVSPKTP